MKRWALVVAGMAVAIRVLAVLVVFEDRFYFSDERNYFEGADAVVAGAWLGTDTMMPPGPVYFLAAAKAAGLDLTGIRLVQAVLGGVVAALVVLLAGMVFGPLVGVVAGFGVAVYPYLVYVSGIIYTQNQAIPLLLLVIYALYRRQRGGGGRWLGVAGIGWGVAGTFMVPSLLTAPVLGLWHAFRVRPWKRGFGDLVILAAVAVMTITPVIVRNYALEGRFVFISSMGGRAFYWANNPDIDPRDRDPEHWIEVNVRRVKEEKLERGWTDAQVDSALQTRAVAYARSEPGRFLRNYLTRVVTMWSFRPQPFTDNPHTASRPMVVAMLSSAPVIMLSLAGMLLLVRRWKVLFPFYAVPLVFTLVFSCFHTTVRYRLTFEPLLIIMMVGLVAAVVVRRGPYRPGLYLDSPRGAAGNEE